MRARDRACSVELPIVHGNPEAMVEHGFTSSIFQAGWSQRLPKIGAGGNRAGAGRDVKPEQQERRDERGTVNAPAATHPAPATAPLAGSASREPSTANAGLLAPFRVRAFRYQWPGDLLTAVAIEMEMVILGWYVLNETGSVLLLTLFGALHFFGTLSAPVIGVIGDRIGLPRLLGGMRAVYVALTTIQTTLALTGQLSPLSVFVVASLMALVRPSDISVRTALVAELMPPGVLTGAVGISRSTGDVARIAGALAGASLFAFFGLGKAYVAVLSLYVAGLVLTIAASMMAAPKARNPVEGAARRSHWRQLGAGLSYVWQKPHLHGGMWLAVLVNLTAFPLTGALMPYIARDVFGLDKTGLGFLLASWATGALLGSLTVGLIGGRLALGRTMLLASGVWHLLLLGFVHAPSALVASCFLVAAGLAQSISMVALAAMLLRTSTPDYHGRIMGVRMLSTYSLPAGLLILGALVERVGFALTASLWLLLGLVLTLAIALWWRGALWRNDAVANG